MYPRTPSAELKTAIPEINAPIISAEEKLKTPEAEDNGVVPLFSIGHLFNAQYRDLAKSQQTDVEPTVASNKALLKYIKQNSKDLLFDNPVIISGSIYQSRFLDNQASLNNHTGLYSDALLALAQEIANQTRRYAFLDEFLLEDVFVDACPEEKSKLLLLYTQIQRFSLRFSACLQWLMLLKPYLVFPQK